MYYYNGAQRYEQFLQVDQLYRALILLGLALFRVPLCLRSSWCYICIKFFFCLHPSLYLLVSWAWWGRPLTSLTNHHPSVLWRYWLGHLTPKIVSEMTYNMSSGTLNTTIPYHSHFGQLTSRPVHEKTCKRIYLLKTFKRQILILLLTYKLLACQNCSAGPGTVAPLGHPCLLWAWFYGLHQYKRLAKTGVLGSCHYLIVAWWPPTLKA